MKYGKKIMVSRQGFHIDSKLLQSVRIHHDSRCRGVFITKNNSNEKDLIVSPFPFSSWGCIVRLQIRVREDKSVNKLNEILTIIASNNFNILSTNFTFGGNNHKTFDLVGEIYELRPYIIKIRSCKNKNKKNRLEYKFRVKLYTYMSKLKILIEEKFKETLYDLPDQYSDSIKKEIKEYLLNNKTISFENFNRIDKEQQVESVYWRWFKGLAFYAFKVKIGADTLYLHYNTKKSILSLENKIIGREFLESFSNNHDDVPILALATFDAEKGYIKLRSFSHTIHDQEFLQIDFSYKINIVRIDYIKKKEKIKNKIINGINEYGSIGMTRDLLSQIIYFIREKYKESFELIGISTKKLSRASLLEEQGLISIQGLFKTKNKTGWQSEEFEDMKANIYDYLKSRTRPKNQYIQNFDITIRKVFPYSVFISVRENFKQRKSFNPHEILKKEGLSAKTSGTFTDEVTENVIQEMSHCDACIQIYSLSQEEIEKITRDGESADFVPDNSWLLFEFGIARTKKMPIVRMIDVTHLNKNQWAQYLRTDNDKLLMEFDSITDKMSLENKMQEAARQVLKKLEKK